jgi:hypothetical protein
MKKVKLIYKDSGGYVSELIIEVPEDADINQVLHNLYGWTILEN